MSMSAEELLTREEMRDVIVRYCRGVDRRDWNLVRTCFTADARHQHLEFIGTTDEFVGFASTVLAGIPSTLHAICGVSFEVDADRTMSEAAFVAYHRIKGDDSKDAPFPTGGVDTDWIVAGRYVDQWRRVDDKWLIADRRAFHDWTRLEPATA